MRISNRSYQDQLIGDEKIPSGDGGRIDIVELVDHHAPSKFQ